MNQGKMEVVKQEIARVNINILGISELKWTGMVEFNSDDRLLIAKFRLKLKKVGKTIWQFRYDLNQIPYDYTAEVTNRLKGLDLIDGGS